MALRLWFLKYYSSIKTLIILSITLYLSEQMDDSHSLLKSAVWAPPDQFPGFRLQFLPGWSSWWGVLHRQHGRPDLALRYQEGRLRLEVLGPEVLQPGRRSSLRGQTVVRPGLGGGAGPVESVLRHPVPPGLCAARRLGLVARLRAKVVDHRLVTTVRFNIAVVGTAQSPELSVVIMCQCWSDWSTRTGN